MKVHVLPGVGFDSNQYLIVGEKSILIDTGSGLYQEETVKFIERQVDMIDSIVLTHRHIDHVGGARTISEKYGCGIFVSRDDSMPLLLGLQEPGISLDIEMPRLDVGIIEYDQVLEDFGLQIIHSPGHTIGSIVLYDRNTRSLFSGDTVFAYGGVGRWDLETGSLMQLRESIGNIMRLDAQRLYPGHGPIVNTNAGKHIRMSLRALEELTD